MTALLDPPPLNHHLRLRERVSLTGTIRDTETTRVGGSPVYRCTLTGTHGEIDLLFLGRTTLAGLTPGTTVTVQGTVAVHCDRLAVWNPRYRILP
jgi:hypothetical protein